MRALVAVLVCLLLLGPCAAINHEVLEEAFGDGPPYYGRDTNMDKWTCPFPELIVIDLITVATTALVCRIVLSARPAHVRWLVRRVTRE